MTTTISDITDIASAVIEINDRFKSQIWWRGHGNANDWRLQPSVFRKKKNEQNMIRRFRQHAPARYSNIPKQEDYYEWLFLIQHYRLPTRLLDWTESPLIAAFFAVEDEQTRNSDGCLYALNPYGLNQNQIGKYKVVAPDNEKAFQFIRKAFIDNANDNEIVVAINPPAIDIRMMTQLSEFTVHGSGKMIEDIPDNGDFLMKFIIPAGCKEKIARQLKHLGIREANIFPDLEHLAKEIEVVDFTEDETGDASNPRPLWPGLSLNSSS